MSGIIDENLFEQIFGHTFIKLADKLINTTNKKRSQIIVKNIKKSKDKIFEKYYFDDWVIKSSNQPINLKVAIDLILDFNENKNEDEYENEDDYYENENEDGNEKEDDDDKTIDQNEIKKLNDYFDKIIDKSKSFEDQIKSLKKREDFKKYYPHKDYDDKELKYKYFKIKLADMSNEIDEKLFEQIFGHTLIKLADKLINTTNKEENQIIVKNINANKIKLDEREKTMPYNWVIQPSYQRINLRDAIKLILDFNESELKNLV